MSEKTHKVAEFHKIRPANTIYCFNIDPSIPNQFFTEEVIRNNRKYIEDCSYDNRLKLFKAYWLSQFRTWKHKGYIQRLVLYLEISPNGLLHWHGICYFHDAQKFNHFLGLNKYVHDKNGIIDVDTMNDSRVWYNYCSKDYDVIGYRYDSDNFHEHLNDDKDQYSERDFQIFEMFTPD